MAFHLKQLSVNDGKQIYDMLQDIESHDNGFNNIVNGMSYENYLLWLKTRDNISRGIDLEEWMVPETYYWMYKDEMPVGHGKIRHILNENLVENSGHIGYAVSMSHRGNGYGNELLRLLLAECDKKGIRIIQVGANQNNVRSNRVILYNGGTLFKTTADKNIYLINLRQTDSLHPKHHSRRL